MICWLVTRGILQCDGDAAYKKFAGPARDAQKVTLVFVGVMRWRGFYDLAKTGTSPIATEALKRIAGILPDRGTRPR